MDLEGWFVAEVVTKAPYVAHRLGVLREYRRGDPQVLDDICESLDWYYDQFQRADFRPVVYVGNF